MLALILTSTSPHSESRLISCSLLDNGYKPETRPEVSQCDGFNKVYNLIKRA